ncbi:hypothetical protein [Bacillus mycoides]|uniref:hypothetical protein n=1 Tax=Bacillus mycoides TaxID=1405 RepID=UPI003D30250D
MDVPIGKGVGKKAYESSFKGGKVVCLIPDRTDAKWWHEYCMNGEVRFVKERLKFNNSKNSVPFTSDVVIFGEKLREIV